MMLVGEFTVRAVAAALAEVIVTEEATLQVNGAPVVIAPGDEVMAQERLTCPVKPPEGVTEMVEAPVDSPGVMAMFPLLPSVNPIGGVLVTVTVTVLLDEL
jgi:hypothetical protein